MGALARLAAGTLGRHRNEETAELLAKSTRAMIVVDGDSGKIVQGNAAAYQLFGPPLVGNAVDRLVPERHQPAHKEHRQDYMRFAVARPMGLGIEVQAVAGKHRREVLVEIGLTPVPGTRLIIAEIDPLEETP